MTGSRLRFAAIGVPLVVITYLVLLGLIGQVQSGNAWGFVMVSWTWGNRFLGLWAALFLVLLLKPPPWAATLIGVFGYVLDNAVVVLQYPSTADEFSKATFWPSNWYGLKLLIYASTIAIPMLWLSVIGRRKQWRLHAIAEVKEWFVLKHKEA